MYQYYLNYNKYHAVWYNNKGRVNIYNYYTYSGSILHYMTFNVMRRRKRIIKMATILIRANTVQYNKDDVGVSVWACPIHKGGEELLCCGLCLCLRGRGPSCTKSGVAGPVQGTRREGSHISSQNWQHRCTQLSMHVHAGTHCMPTWILWLGGGVVVIILLAFSTSVCSDIITIPISDIEFADCPTNIANNATFISVMLASDITCYRYVPQECGRQDDKEGVGEYKM